MKRALILALVAQLAHAEPPADAPVVLEKDGLVCMNDAAVVAEERDREAWKKQLAEAQVQRAGVLAVVGGAGLVVGFLVGFLVVPRLQKP